MDAKNMTILYELSKNSRISNKKLAQKIRLSQPSTLGRVEQLEHKAILLNTHIVINNSALGLQGFRVYLSFSQTTTEIENSILLWLKTHKSTSVIAHCSGNIDVAIIIWDSEPLDCYQFLNELKSQWGKYIGNLTYFTYLKTLFFARSYLIGKNSEFIYANNHLTKQKFDEKDVHILRSLNDDARCSYVDISKKIGLSVKSIIERFKKMKQNGIISGFGVNMDIRSIGYEYYKLSFILTKRFLENDIISFCETIKGVIYVDITLGHYDLELNVEVKSLTDVEDIISKVKEWSGGIVTYDYFQIKKYEKLVFI